MKFLVSQLSYFIADKQARRNLSALRTYLYFILGVIILHSAIFHFIMTFAEGQEHSWLTGFYWTLTVMSTTGFGDITFHTDIGRLFSIVVLMSGIILLLIMLPFAFIRHFYAPWLEARLRNQAPRACEDHHSGHVIICRNDSITPGLIRRLSFNHIPYVILESDPVVAAQMMSGDIEVVTGEIDHRQTYENLRVDKAKLIFANAEDTTNTNIILTAREVSPTIPILALAEEEASLDIFTLSGATYTLPLKRILGEQLAARVGAGIGAVHIVGRFKDLEIAEFLIHHTPLAGKTLTDIGLRSETGVNVVGVWNQGRFQPIRADRPLSNTDVPVAIGTKDQVKRLDKFLGAVPNGQGPVLVIGMGKVGMSTAKALKEKGLPVHVIEKDERLRREIGSQFDRTTYGDAADLHVLEEAGIYEASAVALTTNSDAVNIHLTVYCRRLKPDLNLVSRITKERNIEAIYRAGADFVLSYAFLGREYVTALLLGREPIMVGEGADFFSVAVPDVLVGGDLGSSQIGAKTGLIVIAIERNESTITNPMPGTILEKEARLLMLGTIEQRDLFASEFT
ncbi:MAG: potassium transporter TrkA [Verrucomicrobia bacterium]|nr:MAG: potassium transporter TrkA [Verrucomicrobiota bacterium]